MRYNQLFDSIMHTLDVFDVNHAFDGVEQNLGKYIENKTPLVDALRKHPKWNEDAHAIIMTVTEERKNNIDSLIRMFGDMVDKYLDSISASNLRFSFVWCELLKNSSVDNRDLVDKVNKLIPEMKANIGMKTSRFVKRIFNLLGADIENENFRRDYAKLADALNPYTVEKPFILSVNPNDYLTMSYGNSWASCHIINPDKSRGGETYRGCYKNGCLAYMNDKYTLVGYTLEKLPENLSECALQPKLTRQLFMVDLSVPCIMQSRQYPDTHNTNRATQYRKIVQEIIAEILEIPNLWVKKEGRGVFEHGDNANYPDYNYVQDNHINYSVPSDVEIDECENAYVGERTYCLVCGERTWDCEHLQCDGCGHDGQIQCEDCGEWVDEDDVIWVDDRAVCRDCIDRNYSWCKYCEEYHLDDYTTYVGDIGGYVCDDCLGENFEYCDECGEWYRIDKTEFVDGYSKNGYEWHICENCAEKYYIQCDECGEWHWYGNVREWERDVFLCKDCFAKYEAEKANSENETESEVA